MPVKVVCDNFGNGIKLQYRVCCLIPKSNILFTEQIYVYRGCISSRRSMFKSCKMRLRLSGLKTHVSCVCVCIYLLVYHFIIKQRDEDYAASLGKALKVCTNFSLSLCVSLPESVKASIDHWNSYFYLEK